MKRNQKKLSMSPELEDFVHRASGMMGASAIMHLHVTGKVPFTIGTDRDLFKAFHDTAKELCPGKEPGEAATYIARCMLAQVMDGNTKALHLPFPLVQAWLSLHPGGNIVSLPVNGHIPTVDQTTGKHVTFHIEINTKGAGTIYRYHDVEDSDSNLVGREILLHIDSDGCELAKLKSDGDV